MTLNPAFVLFSKQFVTFRKWANQVFLLFVRIIGLRPFTNIFTIQGDLSGQLKQPVHFVLTVLTTGRYSSFKLPRQDGRTSKL